MYGQKYHMLRITVLDSVVESISACHAKDPSSIPHRAEISNVLHVPQLPVSYHAVFFVGF